MPAASGFSNSTFVTQLRQNEIGGLFDTVRRSNTYRANREASFPLNFFVANPWAASAWMMDNSGWSYFHGGEFEIARRFSSGLFLQANYTFSKVLSDTNFLTSQNESANYISLRNTRLDKWRAQFDVTHSFAANFLYTLPMRRGKALFRNANAFVVKLVAGWNIQGLTRWSSGSPFTITSGRYTLGSGIGTGTTAVLRNMTAHELQKHLGTFKGGTGVYWLNPRSGLFTISGGTSRAVLCQPGQTTPCFDYPGAGENGNLPYNGLNSPTFFNQDFSVIKKTTIPAVSETFGFEIRKEFFNAFSHPNFTGPTTDINGAAFGQLTGVVDAVRGGGVNTRIIQWALRINW